jgi:hypothetical protein
LQGEEIAANYRSEQSLGEKCADNAREKTKPIEEVSRGKCEVSSEKGSAASPPGLPTSHFTLETAA